MDAVEMIAHLGAIENQLQAFVFIKEDVCNQAGHSSAACESLKAAWAAIRAALDSARLATSLYRETHENRGAATMSIDVVVLASQMFVVTMKEVFDRDVSSKDHSGSHVVGAEQDRALGEPVK